MDFRAYLFTFIMVICGIVLSVLLIYMIYITIAPRPEEEKAYQRKLKKSLDDEYILDPETGTKITLEEAQSGNWEVEEIDIDHVLSESELNELIVERDVQAETAINYLKANLSYNRTKFDDEQYNVLANTKMLSKYEDWSFSNLFSFGNDFIFLPAPYINDTEGNLGVYNESQVMFWKEISNIQGHYYFTEKTAADKIYSIFQKEEEISLKKYKCFTFKKSYSKTYIKQILQQFEGQEGLEIEIHDKNLFVKTLVFVNKKDIIRIEKILKQI